jgi:hypothetical protein
VHPLRDEAGAAGVKRENRILSFVSILIRAVCPQNPSFIQYDYA